MKTKFPVFRNADPMSFAFMARRASAALGLVLDNKPIGPDEKDVLAHASKFLREISNGAEISAHGTFQEGLSPIRSLAALEMAFGPMDALRQLVSNEKDVAQLFDNLSQEVERVSATGHSGDAPGAAQSAKKFFDALSVFVLDDLNKRQPPIGLAGGPAFGGL